MISVNHAFTRRLNAIYALRCVLSVWGMQLGGKKGVELHDVPDFKAVDPVL